MSFHSSRVILLRPETYFRISTPTWIAWFDITNPLSISLTFSIFNAYRNATSLLDELDSLNAFSYLFQPF